jgi:hypothetical protein
MPQVQVKMAKKLSDEEIEYINNMDDEFSLLTVPVGYDVLLDKKEGIRVKKAKNGVDKLHIAG